MLSFTFEQGSERGILYPSRFVDYIYIYMGGLCMYACLSHDILKVNSS